MPINHRGFKKYDLNLQWLLGLFKEQLENYQFKELLKIYESTAGVSSQEAGMVLASSKLFAMDS